MKSFFCSFAVMLLLAFPVQAQSSGIVIFTSQAKVEVDGDLTTYRFADGEVAYYSANAPSELGWAEFRDAEGELFADPARGARAARFGIREQGGQFFIEDGLRPGNGDFSRCLIVTPYNRANTAAGRLVYDMIRVGPGRYEIDSESADQSW